MHPDNPVVKLCTLGMQAEQDGRPDDARDLFQQAWDTHADAYEGSIAAHYLARHQPDAQATFRWNLTSLRLAGSAAADRPDDVRGFYPSLHLNMAASYEQLGDPTAARAHIAEAEQRLAVLPPGPYRDIVVTGLGNVRARLE